jgi:hypothetical protein
MAEVTNLIIKIDRELKTKADRLARKTIWNLLLSFSVVSLDGQNCQKAIDLPMGDFEDALLVVYAEKAALNYIITTTRAF